MSARRLGKYVLIERLGRGAMAEVYRAHHATLNRDVAIKIMHNFLADDVDLKGRFEREAQNIARLKHPNIVHVYDFEFDAANDDYYMVMELIEGVNLKNHMAELHASGDVILTLEALRIIRECATALAYAHKGGMIHRDVKPANLIIDQRHDNRIMLTDFGISRLLGGTQHTITGGLVGTPAYLSPEQGAGETGDERSDLYALGVILFQMVTGALPYTADTPLGMILKHLNDPIPSARARKPDLAPGVESLIKKLMAKDPADRYQTANELIENIRTLEKSLQATEDTLILSPDQNAALNIDTRTPIMRPPELFPESRSPRRRLRWMIGALFSIIILGGGYALGAQNGAFPALGFLASDTPSPSTTPPPSATPAEVALVPATETQTPTQTATLTASPTSTSSPTTTPSATNTPTTTPSPTTTASTTPTQTLAPTATATPSPTTRATDIPPPTATASVTPDQTATLAEQMTATIDACVFDYAIIEQSPEDGEAGGFFTTASKYARTITLLNTGECVWERNTSLTFVSGSGESFNAGPRIFIREPIGVGQEVELIFDGTLPARGSLTPIEGAWQLRTPGQLAIGEPIVISVMVYDPGP